MHFSLFFIKGVKFKKNCQNNQNTSDKQDPCCSKLAALTLRDELTADACLTLYLQLLMTSLILLTAKS